MNYFQIICHLRNAALIFSFRSPLSSRHHAIFFFVFLMIGMNDIKVKHELNYKKSSLSIEIIAERLLSQFNVSKTILVDLF